ncbi:MAG: tetratricopeptide repeat protein [Phycisphaeraceae bacterium]
MASQSTLLARAHNLYDADRYELALQAATDALRDDPDAAEPKRLMSLCLTELKRYNEAIDLAEQALSTEPDQAYLHHVLGYAWYLKSRAIDASLPYALKEAGIKGQPIDHAIAAYQEAVRLEPEDATFHEMLAYVFFEADQDEQAESSALAALALDPQRASCYSLLADICRVTRRYKEGHRYALQSLAVDANRSGSHASLGWAKLMHGDASESLDLLREALRLDPTDDYARQGLIEAIKVQHSLVRMPYRTLNWITDLSFSKSWGWICVGIIVVLSLLMVGYSWIVNPQGGQVLAGLLLSCMLGVVLFVVLRMLPVYSMALLTMCNVVLLPFPMGRYALTPWQRYRAAALCGYILPIVAMIGMVVLSSMLGGAPAVELAAEWVVALTLLAGPFAAWSAALTTRWSWPAGIIAVTSVALFLVVLFDVPGVTQMRYEPIPQVLLLVGMIWGLFVPSRL